MFEQVSTARGRGQRRGPANFLGARSQGEAVMLERQDVRALLARHGRAKAYHAMNGLRSSSARDFDLMVRAMRAGGIRKLRVLPVGDFGAPALPES